MSEHSTEDGAGRAGSVVALWRYSVKSMAGERLEVASIAADGIAGDRRFAVCDIETGKIASPETTTSQHCPHPYQHDRHGETT